MDVFRLVLVSGLIFHKGLWQALKIKSPIPTPERQVSSNFGRLVIKAIKVIVLIFLIVQALFLDILPISEEPTGLRISGMIIYFAGFSLSVAGRLQLGKNWVDLEDSHVLP